MLFSINEVNLYGIARYLVAQRGKVCLRVFYTTPLSPDFGLLMLAKKNGNFHNIVQNVTQKVEYIDYYGKDVYTAGLSVIQAEKFAYMQPYIVGKTIRTRARVERLLADFGVAVKPQSISDSLMWDTSILKYGNLTYKYTPQLTKDLDFNVCEDRYLVSECQKNIFILPTTVWRHVPAELLERVVLDTQTGTLTVRYCHVLENKYIVGQYVWDTAQGAFVTQEYNEVEITGYKEA